MTSKIPSASGSWSSVQAQPALPGGDQATRQAGTQLPPLPRQRRTRMFLLGLLLIAAGALVAAYLFLRASDRTPVVVVTRDVPVGTTITAADVGTATVAADEAVATIPGRQARDVVGRVAAVDLRKGTLLAPSQLTNVLSPREGEQVVPVALRSTQVPARGLQPGDRVLVIATPGSPGQGGSAAEGSAPLTQDVPATVDRVSGPDAEGFVVVDLLVTSDVGPAIAQQASTGRLALIVTTRGAGG